MLSTVKRDALKRLLNRLYRTFDAHFIETDPVMFVHEYKKDADREIAGLVSSSLAYGRVDGIKRSVERVLSVMGKSPFRFTMDFNPERDSKLFDGFRHRFNAGKDIAALVCIAQRMILESGSIGDFFLKGYDPSGENIKTALSEFSRGALRLVDGRIYGSSALPKDAGVRFFFPDPLDKSPCKRLNLYLRWMVRRGDEVDFGIWKRVSPSKLVIPLDTHVARISKNIGLTSMKIPGWAMAEEITRGLKRLDPADPVKYDFAICRLGILEKCPKGRDIDKCGVCAIRDICALQAGSE